MTMTGRDWERLQREIDGENSTDESAALRERLAHDPELVSHYQALVGVGGALGKVRLVEPPAELVRDVMRAVRKGSLAQAQGSGAFGRLRAQVTARPALALAASLAVGLAAGMVVTGLSGGRLLGPLDESSVSGTVLPPGALADLAGLAVLDRARLDGPGVEASAVLRGGPEVLVAELEIVSEGAVDVTVEVDETALRPRGFECLGGEPAGGVVVEPGRVEVRRATAGRCFVTLDRLGEDPGSLSVRVRTRAGGADAEATLRVTGPTR